MRQKALGKVATSEKKISRAKNCQERKKGAKSCKSRRGLSQLNVEKQRRTTFSTYCAAITAES